MQYTAFGPLSGGFSNNPPVEVGLICERLTDLPSAVGPGGAALRALASVGDGPGGARPAQGRYPSRANDHGKANQCDTQRPADQASGLGSCDSCHRLFLE